MTISVTYDYFEGFLHLQEEKTVKEEEEETFRKSGSIIEIPIRSSSCLLPSNYQGLHVCSFNLAKYH